MDQMVWWMKTKSLKGRTKMWTTNELGIGRKGGKGGGEKRERGKSTKQRRGERRGGDRTGRGELLGSQVLILKIDDNENNEEEDFDS